MTRKSSFLLYILDLSNLLFIKDNFYYYYSLKMRYGFGFNTDLLETNVLNLVVVIGIVVTVVGDAIRSLLDERRLTLLSSLKAATLRGVAADRELEEAQKALDISRLQAEEILNQARITVEKEKLLREQNLEKDLNRLKESNNQRIQIEQQRVIQCITREVMEEAFRIALEKLHLRVVAPQARDSQMTRTQKETIEKALYETLPRLLPKSSEGSDSDLEG